VEITLFKRLSDRLAPGLLWTSAVHLEEAGFDPRRAFRSAPTLFDPRKRPRTLDFVHTLADPFLFARGNLLYLFLEAQASGRPGHIEANVTADGRRWEPLGPVLVEPHHLSYPFVFEQAGQVYMIPESGAAGEVALYRFHAFPQRLRRERALLGGSYVDTSPVLHEGHWYLFTTGPRGLELFVTDDLVGGTLRPHPASPITDDPRFQRCGGAPIRIGTHLYRIAQDCAERYGGDLNLLRIDLLTPDHFRETLDTAGLLKRTEHWNRLGGHHLSVAPFAGGIAIAVDGQARDHLRHKLGSARRKLFGRR
jgi:hypothetical protein